VSKKEKVGQVISNKMEKTIVVKVSEYSPHPIYKKIIETTKHYKVHDEKGLCGEGDLVRIIEAKPVSKTKNWAVAEVLEKAR
jgi:small subunit ribosomal protein S17